MYFVKNLFIGASLVVAALAQSKLGFTTVPTSVQAGSPTVLKWSGGDSPVTLTLKKGLSTDLKTVLVITSAGTGGSFTWTPPKTLADGDDYAFQISQGEEINYSGQFTFSGGSGSSGSKTSASKSSSSAASVTSALSSIVSSISSAKNPKITKTIAPANTTAILIGTGFGTAASSGGTGIHISRNATLSHPTLKSSSTKTATTTSSLPASTEVTSTGTATGTSPAGSSTTGASGNSAANLASPLAFVITAFVAIIYLG